MCSFLAVQVVVCLVECSPLHGAVHNVGSETVMCERAWCELQVVEFLCGRLTPPLPPFCAKTVRAEESFEMKTGLSSSNNQRGNNVADGAKTTTKQQTFFLDKEGFFSFCITATIPGWLEALSRDRTGKVLKSSSFITKTILERQGIVQKI